MQIRVSPCDFPINTLTLYLISPSKLAVRLRVKAELVNIVGAV